MERPSSHITKMIFPGQQVQGLVVNVHQYSHPAFKFRIWIAISEPASLGIAARLLPELQTTFLTCSQ